MCIQNVVISQWHVHFLLFSANQMQEKEYIQCGIFSIPQIFEVTCQNHLIKAVQLSTHSLTFPNNTEIPTCSKPLTFEWGFK